MAAPTFKLRAKVTSSPAAGPFTFWLGHTGTTFYNYTGSKTAALNVYTDYFIGDAAFLLQLDPVADSESTNRKLATESGLLEVLGFSLICQQAVDQTNVTVEISDVDGAVGVFGTFSLELFGAWASMLTYREMPDGTVPRGKDMYLMENTTNPLITPLRPNHGLVVGDVVAFTAVKNADGSMSAINGLRTVSAVPDANSFRVTLASPPGAHFTYTGMFGKATGQVPKCAPSSTFSTRTWNVINTAYGSGYPRPSQINTTSALFLGDYDKINWRGWLAAFVKLGYNSISLQESYAVSPVTRTLMLEAGMTKTAHARYRPPGALFEYHTNEPDPTYTSYPATPTGRATWANSIKTMFTTAGWAATDVTQIAMSDEPAWLFPDEKTLATTGAYTGSSGYPFTADVAAANTAFRAFLTAQGSPITDSGFFPVAISSMTPTYLVSNWNSSTLANRRAFYWTMRWYAQASADNHAKGSAALETAFYPNIVTSTNWATYTGRFFQTLRYPGIANVTADDSSGCHDWGEFAKQRGGTVQWGEDHFGDAHAWRWIPLASRLRSTARKSGGTTGIGGYVVPRVSLGTTADGMLRRQMALVSQGAKTVWQYAGAAVWAFKDSHDQAITQTPELTNQIISINRMIGRSETLLFPGQPRADIKVAILYPKSSFPWDAATTALTDLVGISAFETGNVDYLSEAHLLTIALAHAGIQVEWVEEGESLSQYKVLFVTAPNIPTATQAAISAWVANGGALITTPGAGTYDEYNTATPAGTTSLTGITETLRVRQYVPNVYSFATSFPIGSAAYNAWGESASFKSTVTAGSGNTVEATFDAGGSAIVKSAVNSNGGFRRHFAFFPALSYLRSSNWGSTGVEIDYPQGTPAIRNTITQAVSEKAVVEPVTINKSMVEVNTLTSASGYATTLINWSNADTGAATVTIRPPFIPTRVYSARTNTDLAITDIGGGAYTVPLSALPAVDVLSIYATASSVSLTERWGRVSL
jgi:hypothetical protein